ncbi:MAG: amino acid racemase [Tabrizicola sp.]|jgi:aspartate racemase|nr:amino acid racemase [Tabrizicola sp.]
MKTVGILGGMGPEATVLLMQRLLAAVDARDDADHIPLIVHQNPAVPSRIRRLIEGTGEDPGPVLAQMARDLQAAGAEALAIPCNTAHAYAPQIMAATPLPFLDMRAATVAALPKGSVVMLASPAVRLTGAFDAAFSAAGVTPVWPEDEGPVLTLIRRVKAGDTGADAHAAMAALAEAAEGHVLVACTELSLLTGALQGPFTDSLDCLVEAIRDFAKS